MSDLITSLEKSVRFMKKRYPANHTLLTNLEWQLQSLKERKQQSSENAFKSEKSKPKGLG